MWECGCVANRFGQHVKSMYEATLQKIFILRVLSNQAVHRALLLPARSRGPRRHNKDKPCRQRLD
jgi:hypothetical protein